MVCELCQCEEADNFHHLIPRTVHSNKWFKKRFSTDQMRRGINVCRQCHRAVHDLVPDEKELGREYHTLEKLGGHPKIAAYVLWKRKKMRVSRSGKL